MWEDHLNQLEEFYVEEMVDLFHRRVWPGNKILDLRFNFYLHLHNNLGNFLVITVVYHPQGYCFSDR